MLLHSPLHHFAPQKANSDLRNHGWFQFWFTYDRCFGVSNQACHASCACATVAVMPPARKTWAPCAVPDLFNPCWSAWNQIVYQHSMRFVGANHHPESKLFCGTIEGVLHLACILCLCRSTKLGPNFWHKLGCTWKRHLCLCWCLGTPHRVQTIDMRPECSL